MIASLTGEVAEVSPAAAVVDVAGVGYLVHVPDGIVHGTTRGLDPDGYLIVRKDDGTDTLILAGGVRAAGA